MCICPYNNVKLSEHNAFVIQFHIPRALSNCLGRNYTSNPDCSDIFLFFFFFFCIRVDEYQIAVLPDILIWVNSAEE